METELVKCQLESCGKEFHPRKGKIYCSSSCRSKASIIRSAGMGNAAQSLGQATLFPETKKEKEAKPRERFEAPTGLPPHAQYIVSHLTRERDKAEKLADKLEDELRKEKNEVQKLREQLAELKTDQRIKEIENAKPGGLDGLAENPLVQQLLPYVGPKLGDFLGRILEGGTPQLTGAPGTANNEAVAQIVNWFNTQPPDVQEIFYMLVNDMAGKQPEELKVKMGYIKNLLNYGSTATGTNG